MTTQELLKYHQAFCAQALEIVKKKNHDYAGADGQTPFANFEVAEKLNICKTESGFILRVADKLMRLITYTNSGELKVSESADDACIDVVNYMILLSAYLHEKQTKNLNSQ
jgi:hypothetical protein